MRCRHGAPFWINTALLFGLVQGVPSKTLYHCLFRLNLEFVGCARVSGDMVGTFVSNSDALGCIGVRVMTGFGSYVVLEIFKYMGVYEGI